MSGSQWKVDVLLAGNWRGASSILLTNGRQPVLVDTGMPHDAHQLLGALAERGLKPSDIPCIINTHFHLDHVSNNHLFPGSVIYATQQSHDWCRALYADLVDPVGWKTRALKYYPETYEYERSEDLMGKLRKIALRWWNVRHIGSPSQFRWIETHPLLDGIEALFTAGHVPGHAPDTRPRRPGAHHDPPLPGGVSAGPREDSFSSRSDYSRPRSSLFQSRNDETRRFSFTLNA